LQIIAMACAGAAVRARAGIVLARRSDMAAKRSASERRPGAMNTPVQARDDSSAGAADIGTLRPMAKADLDRVLAVEVQAYGFPWSRGNFADSLAAGYTAELLEQRNCTLIGYYLGMPGVGEMHLLNLTVAPAFQGRGFAHRLMDRLEARARELGLTSLWLEVRASNARARALYGRRGFTEVGVRRGYYPAASSRREDAVVMSRLLAGAHCDATADATADDSAKDGIRFGTREDAHGAR
jgi:ribosomal-protein-alanine N-acetyltransferase